MALLEQPDIRLARTRSLECKAVTLADQISHPLNHDPAGFECRGLHMVRRDAPRNLIRIQECVNAQLLRQKNLRRRSFARAIGTAEDDNVFHVKYPCLIPNLLRI